MKSQLLRTMPIKRSNEETACSGKTPRRRKLVSEAEKEALKLSKIFFSFEIKCQDTTLSAVSARRNQTHCTWRDEKFNPCYCRESLLNFESNMPDRNFLTRFSVKCHFCYERPIKPALHLHCAYCNDVLTGTIASPGGKISDHLVTIRHVYQRSLAVIASMEGRSPNEQDRSKAHDYLLKLEAFSEKIRYPATSPVNKIDFDDAVRRIRLLLNSHSTSFSGDSVDQKKELLPSANMQIFLRPLLCIKPDTDAKSARESTKSSDDESEVKVSPAIISDSQGPDHHECTPAEPSIDTVPAKSPNSMGASLAEPAASRSLQATQPADTRRGDGCCCKDNGGVEGGSDRAAQEKEHDDAPVRL
jgi:hypothetical protein